MLFGHEDLRVVEVGDPVAAAGEVVVRIEAVTTCGTDVKTWRRGHPLLGPYPAAFGHETCGIREDTGERVLVGDSVACGSCRQCTAGPAADLPRRALGVRRLRRAHGRSGGRAARRAGRARSGGRRDGRAARRRRARDRPRAGPPAAPDAGVLGGGPMGQMLAALLVAEGRTVTVADRHAERRAQAEATGAMSAERLADHDVVFEAVGRPDAWRAAVQACAPGGCVVFVGGCKGDADASLPTRPLHYDELDLRGAFHHSREEVDRALALLAGGALDWRSLSAGPIGLDDLPHALAAGNDGPARKWVVIP